MSSKAALPATGGLRCSVVDTFDIFAVLALIKEQKKKRAHKQKFSSTDLPKSFLSTVFQYTNSVVYTSFSTDKTTSEPL